MPFVCFMGCGARLCVCLMFSTASLFGAHADRVPTEEVETLRDLAVREGIATIEDIAYWFSSVDEAAEAGLGHSWTLAKTLARVNPAGMASIASASRAQLVPTAPPMIAGQASRATGARGTSRVATQSVASRGQSMSTPDTEEADRAARIDAALRIAEVSLEWRSSLSASQQALVRSADGPVVRKIAKFEVRGLRGVLKAWTKWCTWCQGRGEARVPAAGCSLTVEAFLQAHSMKRTSGRKLWNQLQWLVRHVAAPFKLESPPPVADPVTGEVFPVVQATVLEPEMLFVFNEIGLDRGHHLQLAGAGVHAMIYSWVRYAHLLRSRPLERSDTAVVFRCYRGKKGKPGSRMPFDWCLPRGRNADLMWDQWHKAAAVRAAQRLPPPGGIVFDTVTGRPIPEGVFNRWLKIVFAKALAGGEDSDMITSYSLRRFGPTLADAIGMKYANRVICGGWSESNAQGRNSMPVRYSGQRREAEMSTRLLCVRLLDHLQSQLPSPLRWENVRGWAATREGRVAIRSIMKVAAADVAASSVWERAQFLPLTTAEQLRRLRFRHLVSAQRGRHPVSAPSTCANGTATPTLGARRTLSPFVQRSTTRVQLPSVMARLRACVQRVQHLRVEGRGGIVSTCQLRPCRRAGHAAEPVLRSAVPIVPPASAVSHGVMASRAACKAPLRVARCR